MRPSIITLIVLLLSGCGLDIEVDSDPPVTRFRQVSSAPDPRLADPVVGPDAGTDPEPDAAPEPGPDAGTDPVDPAVVDPFPATRDVLLLGPVPQAGYGVRCEQLVYGAWFLVDGVPDYQIVVQDAPVGQPFAPGDVLTVTGFAWSEQQYCNVSADGSSGRWYWSPIPL